jgi:hypothetical protein
MTKIEMLMQERDDLQAKITSARESPGNSERAVSDLKMMEQELIALEQRIGRANTESESTGTGKPASKTEKMEKKLDDALRDSFPGSDPVSTIEPAPSPPQDKAAKAANR